MILFPEEEAQAAAAVVDAIAWRRDGCQCWDAIMGLDRIIVVEKVIFNFSKSLDHWQKITKVSDKQRQTGSEYSSSLIYVSINNN